MFFDYGGTLSTERFHGVPSETAATAVAMVNARGLLAIVVSNQKGVAQGHLTWRELGARRDGSAEFLQKRGARVDAWYFCPHDADDHCDCRKPKPGMLLSAAQDLALDLAGSAVIGDRDDRDVAAGRAVGALTALILRDEKSRRGGVVPDLYALDVVDATGQVLAALFAGRAGTQQSREPDGM